MAARSNGPRSICIPMTIGGRPSSDGWRWWQRSGHCCCWTALWATTVIVGILQAASTQAIRRGNLVVPSPYTAGNGDMHVQFHYDFAASSSVGQAPPNDAATLLQDLRLQITRYENQNQRAIVAIVDVFVDPRSNVTQISIPCQTFLLGGNYELEIVGNDLVPAASFGGGAGGQDERLRQVLDVRWPVPKLSVTSDSVGTYPDNPVDVILDFPGCECNLRAADVQNVPEFWLELFYCGHDVYCDSSNVSTSQILYAEQVRGYPKARLVKLRCELIGLAGHYIVKLRPVGQVLASVTAMAYIKADWSDQFVFNVHARSISPCDPHSGIGVLFEYPACILDRADRVRLFAKLRADVASLAPPTTLHYVTEQRVVRGQHSLHFDCELFSEKYIEYCFVYVSQAISGAVADIRMDCLPTLPVSDSDVGGWGAWSDWTPCSTTCAGGTKNRYRVCDSPPPRYGAKFCEGDAVETTQCGGSVYGTWDCMYGNNGNAFGGQLPADRPEVKAEIGPGCRCGCIVHLSMAKRRRLIASSAESCPGRTFWLVQADPDYRIEFSLDFFRLVCPSQYVRIRDGDSLASDLIAEYVGGRDNRARSVVSTESQILLEFYSNELSMLGESCKGGFLIHAQQTQQYLPNVTISVTSRTEMSLQPTIYLSAVHLTAVLFAAILIIVSALLGTQYIFRYRKYQLAENAGTPDSPSHTPTASMGSIPLGARATSTSTLLSEVSALIKMRPRLAGRSSNKHSRLRESVDVEALRHCADGGADNKANGENAEESNAVKETKMSLSPSDGDLSLGASTHTLTNESPSSRPVFSADSSKLQSPDEHLSGSEQVSSSNTSPGDGPASLESCSPPSHQHSMGSLPTETPMPPRKWPRRSIGKKSGRLALCSGGAGQGDVDSDTQSMNGRMRPRKLSDVSGRTQREDDSGTDTEGALRVRRLRKLNGCYSPASSLASTATIRTNNVKESKEKKNREKLLAGPGSEFSLANPEDFELDYYDYNVSNAGAVPGSYLGMDPAYLVWIPPLDGGDILQEIEDDDDRIDDDEEPHYEEILPNYSKMNVDPGSNADTASDDEDEAPHLPPLNAALSAKSQHAEQTKNQRNAVISKVIAANLLSSDLSLDKSNANSSTSKGAPSASDLIPMHDLSGGSTSTLCNKYESPARVHGARIARKAPSEEEKETTVVKSPEATRGSLDDLDDIQFADDEEDEDVTFDNRNATLKSAPVGLSSDPSRPATVLAGARRVV